LSLSTFSDLKSSVANWLNRANLTARIPEFVQLAEARIAYGSIEQQFSSEPLRIRSMETSASLTVNAQTVALPTGYLSPRRLYLATTPIAELEYTVPDVFWRTWLGSNQGQPQSYTIEGENLVFGPSPDVSYTGQFLYYKKFTALSADGDTNWLLTNSFGTYLHGTLLEAYKFIRNTEMALVETSAFVGSINALNLADKSDRYASPWRARPDSGSP